MAIYKIFRDSFRELKSFQCVVVTGLLVAVYLVMETFLSIPTPYLKLNFAFIALAVIGMLYGPSVAIIAAIPCDILGAFLSPAGGSVIFVFTFIAMFEGLVYGLCLYKYDITQKKSLSNKLRIVIAQTIVVVVSRMVFNTVALMSLGFLPSDPTALKVSITTRIVKNIIELPIDIALMFAVLVPINLIYYRVVGKNRKGNTA